MQRVWLPEDLDDEASPPGSAPVDGPRAEEQRWPVEQHTEPQSWHLAHTAPTSRRKRPLIVGGIVALLVVAGFGAWNADAVQRAIHPAGPYTGAPVTSVDRPSQPDAFVVVSPDEAVAFEAGTSWVDIPDWVGVDDPNANFPAWSTHVGEFFMGSPGDAGTVLVLETDTESLGLGRSLEDVHDAHVQWMTHPDGIEASAVDFDVHGTSRVDTPYGLVGYETRYTLTMASTAFDCAMLTFMRGDRIVFVNLNGMGHSLEEQPYLTVLNTLRIDE